jgi:hypothetical protein
MPKSTYTVTFVNWIPEYAEVDVKASSFEEALAKAQDNWPSEFEPSDQSCKETIERIDQNDGKWAADICLFPGVQSLTEVAHLDRMLLPASVEFAEREEALRQAQKARWDEIDRQERAAKRKAKAKTAAKRIKKGAK